MTPENSGLAATDLALVELLTSQALYWLDQDRPDLAHTRITQATETLTRAANYLEKGNQS